MNHPLVRRKLLPLSSGVNFTTLLLAFFVWELRGPVREQKNEEKPKENRRRAVEQEGVFDASGGQMVSKGLEKREESKLVRWCES